MISRGRLVKDARHEGRAAASKHGRILQAAAAVPGTLWSAGWDEAGMVARDEGRVAAS
jgi:hypothetical protein